MRRFLIVKSSSLGDIVHAWPVASYLREKFPDCQIDWVVEKRCLELVAAHPQIDRALTIDSKGWKKGLFTRQVWQEISQFRQQLKATEYDALFDLQANSKSAWINLQARAKAKVGYGWNRVAQWPNLLTTRFHFSPPHGKNVREDCLYPLQQFFSDPHPYTAPTIALRLTAEQQKQLEQLLPLLERAAKRTIMICPGSAWRNKQLTEPQLQQLIAQLSTQQPSHFFLIWGNPEERQLAERLQQQLPQQISIIDRQPFPVLQHLMNRVDLVVAMDSLALHLAGTTSAATLGLFGPTLGAKYSPNGEKAAIFQGSCPYGRQWVTRCPIMRSCPTGACLRDVDPRTINTDPSSG